MTKIITTTELQRNIGNIRKMTADGSVVVTKNGRGSYVILPYFDDNSETIENYLEDFEMSRNKEVLKKKYKKSAESGNSTFII